MTHWIMEWVNRHPPIQWELGATGPDAYDCWSWVREVWRKHYGLCVPIISVSTESKSMYVRRFSQHDERRNWVSVEAPRDGDAVLLGTNRFPTHVGVWIDLDGGRVAHCYDYVGLLVNDLPALRAAQWGSVKFYRHSSLI